MSYHWKPTSRIRHRVDAEAVGAWLERLRNAEGELTAEIILTHAQRRNSPINELITWQTQRAAHLHQLKEVRSLMTMLRVTRGGSSVRAFWTIRRGGGNPSTFEPVDRVMRNSAMREQRIRAAYRELESWRERWGFISDLQDIANQLETITMSRASE